MRKVRGARVPTPKQVKRIGKILGPSELTLLRGALGVLVLAVLWYSVGLVLNARTVVPAVGGKYTEALVGSPQLINPIFASVNDVDQDIVSLVYSGLMKYENGQNLVPDLAESYTISDDKKTYTFTLRDDVLWHDGEPFIAQDVVYTIQTIQNTQVGSPLQVSFRGVDVFAEDEHTVTFVLQEPFAPFLSSLTLGILPEHIWFDVSPERMKLHGQNLQPVGTGPYAFKRFQKDEAGNIYRFELLRNETYYGEKPYIEEFSFQFFRMYDGDTGAIQALRSKRVDGLGFVPQDLKQNVARKHITLHTLQLPQYTALFLNDDQQPILKDDNVRLALAHALDKQRLLQEALDGEGQLLHGPILPGFPGYSEDTEVVSYSVDAANELLDESWERIPPETYVDVRRGQLLADYGLTTTTIPTSTEDAAVTTTAILAEIDATILKEMHETQTFFRQNDDGELFTIHIVTTDSEEYQNVSGLVAAAWREIGVNVIIDTVDVRSIARDVLRGRKYDVLLYGVILGSDPDQFPFWHSTQITYPGLNLSRYENTTVDALLEDIRELEPGEEQSQKYAELQDLILEDRPAYFLYMPTYTYATTDDVKGLGVERIFRPSDRFADVARWYVKTKSVWGQQ